MSDKMEVFKKHVNNLHNLIVQSGELLEGNCVYYHNTLTTAYQLESKQRNLLKSSINKQEIMEIGFNAGHSLLLFLLNAPTATYTIFDICHHGYVKPCFEYLKTAFPDAKLTLIAGDSTITVPNYIKENPNALFDLIHVDGGHAEQIALSDMAGAIQLCAPNGIIILDDTQDPVLASVGHKYEKSGHLLIDQSAEQTYMYQHQIYIRTSQK